MSLSPYSNSPVTACFVSMTSTAKGLSKSTFQKMNRECFTSDDKSNFFIDKRLKSPPPPLSSSYLSVVLHAYHQIPLLFVCICVCLKYIYVSNVLTQPKEEVEGKSCRLKASSKTVATEKAIKLAWEISLIRKPNIMGEHKSSDAFHLFKYSL